MKFALYTRSELLKAAIEKNHLLVFNWVYDTASGRGILPLNFHQELAEAIIVGDPQRAESVMRDHVQCGLKAVLHAIKREDGKRWRLKRDGTLYVKSPKPSPGRV